MFEYVKLLGPLVLGFGVIVFFVVGAAMGWIRPGRLNSQPAQPQQQNTPITCGWNAWDPSHPCAATSMGR